MHQSSEACLRIAGAHSAHVQLQERAEQAPEHRHAVIGKGFEQRGVNIFFSRAGHA
jgi:hypothetical protein